jgi:Haem-degrading
MRRRGRPRNGAKKRLNASSARKREWTPPPNPRKCRTFPRERRRSRKNWGTQMFAGGIPLTVSGVIVGAVGVSGSHVAPRRTGNQTGD